MRSPEENEAMIGRLVEYLSTTDGSVKTFAAREKIPHSTVHNYISRYKRRHGIKNLYFMVADHVRREGK